MKARCSLSVDALLPEPYSLSKEPRLDSARSLLALAPLQTRCICPAALKRCRSACRFSRSACAFDTALVAFEAEDGLQEVLENGFPAWPLRLTFRGRRELPVNVENMMATWASFLTGGTDYANEDGGNISWGGWSCLRALPKLCQVELCSRRFRRRVSVSKSTDASSGDGYVQLVVGLEDEVSTTGAEVTHVFLIR